MSEPTYTSAAVEKRLRDKARSIVGFSRSEQDRYIVVYLTELVASGARGNPALKHFCQGLACDETGDNHIPTWSILKEFEENPIPQPTKLSETKQSSSRHHPALLSIAIIAVILVVAWSIAAWSQIGGMP